MEIRLLNTFVTVAKLKNFTQAAETLGYAQSSITSQIQALESELAVRLFERLGKSVSLTPAGEQLLPYAAQILKLCADAKDTITPGGLIKGALTIGSPESLCEARLLPVYTEFHKRFPDVELSLKFGCCCQFMDMLKENQIDLAFYIAETQNMPEFVSTIQWLEPIVLLGSPLHPIFQLDSVVPGDLANQHLILTEQGCSYRASLMNFLRESGISAKSTFESESVQVMKQLAISGMGIAFLPKAAALGELASGQLAELRWMGPAFDMTTQLVHHKDKWISPAMRAFISLAGDMFRQAQGIPAVLK